MVGRGREATLPAWQTASYGAPGAPGGLTPGPSGQVPARAMAPGPGGQGGWQGFQPPGGPGLGPPGGQPWQNAQGMQRPQYPATSPGMGRPGFPVGPRGGDAFPQQGYHQPPGMMGYSPMQNLAQPAGAPQFRGPPQMSLQQMPVASPTPQASPSGAPKSAWTEHTAPDGRKYYYNAATKTSSWSKPAEMMATPEAPVKQETNWKEFTAPDGRKYYYNRVTKESKWQIPDELAQAQASNAAQKSSAKPAGIQIVKLSEASPHRASPAVTNGYQGTPTSLKDEEMRMEQNAFLEPKKPVFYATKEEAKEAFKELLVSVATRSNATWEGTMRLIANDPRYQAFKTIGEKKACFNEYLQQRAKEEREEARMRAKENRDNFFTLLELSPDLKAGTRYSKAAVIFDDEPRWRAIKDPREREQLFTEHMKERDRKDKEIRRAELKRRRADFRKLLESHSGIKADTTWKRAQAKLEGEEEYEALEKIDRLEVFEENFRELEKADKERKDKEREEKRRQERRHRDAFKQLLREHAANGFILPKMSWKEYHSFISDEDALKAIERNITGSRPKELFEDVLEDIEEEYTKSCAELKAAKIVEASAETSFEEYNSALQASDDKLLEIPEAHRKVYYDELVGKLKEIAAKEAKRKRRALDDFNNLLRDVRKIKYDTTWADGRAYLEKEPEYKALEAAEKEDLFNKYIEKLKARRDKEKAEAKEKEKLKEKEKEKEEKRREAAEEEKPRKDKKHKKERHAEKDKEKDKDKHKDKTADKKTKDKEKDRHGKRRNTSDGDDDDKDKRSSKRHRKDKHLETEAPLEPDANQAEGMKDSPPKNKTAGGTGSDAEEGEL